MRHSGFTATRRVILAMGASLASFALLSGTVMAQTKPKIGFIGAGKIGGTLAKLWTEAGYQVMLSARDLGPVQQLGGAAWSQRPCRNAG